MNDTRETRLVEPERRQKLASLPGIGKLREFRFDQNLIDTSRPLGWAAFLRRR